MNRRYPALSRLFLIALVAVPAVLRHIDSRLEVYPALLLPAGAPMARRVDDTVVLHSSRSFAELADGTIHPIDLSRVLIDVPPSHHMFVMRNDFGISRVAADPERADDYRELSQWLRDHLARTGLPDARTIVIARTRSVIDIAGGNVLEREVLHEKRMALAD